MVSLGGLITVDGRDAVLQMEVRKPRPEPYLCCWA